MFMPRRRRLLSAAAGGDPVVLSVEGDYSLSAGDVWNSRKRRLVDEDHHANPREDYQDGRRFHLSDIAESVSNSSHAAFHSHPSSSSNIADALRFADSPGGIDLEELRTELAGITDIAVLRGYIFSLATVMDSLMKRVSAVERSSLGYRLEMPTPPPPKPPAVSPTCVFSTFNLANLLSLSSMPVRYDANSEEVDALLIARSFVRPGVVNAKLAQSFLIHLTKKLIPENYWHMHAVTVSKEYLAIPEEILAALQKIFYGAFGFIYRDNALVPSSTVDPENALAYAAQLQSFFFLKLDVFFCNVRSAFNRSPEHKDKAFPPFQPARAEALRERIRRNIPLPGDIPLDFK